VLINFDASNQVTLQNVQLTQLPVGRLPVQLSGALRVYYSPKSPLLIATNFSKPTENGRPLIGVRRPSTQTWRSAEKLQTNQCAAPRLANPATPTNT
jgi:hypothetical protein